MKIYRYWVVEKENLGAGKNTQTLTSYGGSNLSEAEARLRAREKMERLKSKIAGDRQAFEPDETYEVEIREEIVREIDDGAIITRNRYGAQVLNTQDLMIMDIDKPKFSFWDLFKKPEDKKAKIIERIRKLAQKSEYAGCGFRIYETFNGIRVLVLGKTFDPKANSTLRMLHEFNCDPLYIHLCNKQGCFRARLTPKPTRLKLRYPKVRFPRNVEDENKFIGWLAQYESASRNYSVCKMIEQIGAGSLTETVRLHDEICGTHWNQPLA